MVSVQQLSMHFTGEDLFTDIGFLIREKDRIGLVGKNGAGKTTLLRLIFGLDQPHKGTVVVPEGISIGYLPQEKVLDSEETVLGEALKAFSHIRVLEDEIAVVSDQLSQRDDYDSLFYHQLVDRLSHLNERLAIFGAYSMEGDAEQILIGLGFEHADMHRKMQTFSNGWQMRVELAKLLLQQPSLLLLDEPTNHLDIESIQWLEKFLLNYSGSIMLVSHDRAFLDNVTKRTIEISQARIYDYKASYSEYLQMRNARLETQTAAYQNQQREVKEIERFVERFRYKASKAKQVQSRVKQLERMEEIDIEALDKKGIYFKFPPAPHSGKVTIEAKGLSKAYGSLKVLDSLDLLITRGERIAFVGRNGEGKSTLAKILAGVLQHEGELRLGHQVEVGYYAQNQHDMLDMSKTVFETLDEVAVGDVRTRLKSILGAFMFSGDAVDKKVKVLSGGEKARLSLAKMLLFPSNLLILDEPTNHLDMHSKDILKTALLQFDGTLLIVSHDRDFLQGLTNKVFEFRKPVVKPFIGDIYDFLEHRSLKQLSELEAKSIENHPDKERQSSVSTGKVNWEKRKQLEKEKRKSEKEIEGLEARIEDLESQIKQCEFLLHHPESAEGVILDASWYQDYEQLRQNLQLNISEWERSHEQLELIESEIKKHQ